MRPVRSGDHLEQIGETWYYRRVVPRDVHGAFEWEGKKTKKVRFSLHTKSHSEAKRLEKIHDVEFEAKLAAARNIGPDGHPRNREARLAKFLNDALTQANNDPELLEQQLAEIPEDDRDEIDEIIDALAEEGETLDVELDRFWHEELKDLILWSDEPEEWAVRRANIVGLVRDYFESSRGRCTVDWAYDEWKNARKRPQQTADEARRYLDEFKRSARVTMLENVRRRHVTDWRTSLTKAGDLAPKSINHRLEIVTAILRMGWREAETENPPDLKKINVEEATVSDRTSWTEKEILQELGLLEPRSGPAWLYVVALTTGTRIGEPAAARREWYDPLGFIKVPARFTKMKKPHTMPIIDLLREPLAQHIQGIREGDFIFDVPRPSNEDLKISHEVSKWFSRLHHKHKIPKVMHELRHTWIEAARYSEIKREIYEIISGHSGKTVSDGYGGERPDELLKANETICAKFLTAEMRAAIQRLIT